MPLLGKKIILAITGSISAYKSAFLVRLLIKRGASVRVIMTPSATQFIAPLTLSTLSKNNVISTLTSEESWNDHVHLGLWADAFVVAPCSANTLGKMANGLCDNILTAVYLSARCPVFFAPAMDVDMWHHPSTQHNIARLVSFGNKLIPVGKGELASGLEGEGRMAEPEEICAMLEQHFSDTQTLQGKKIIVTAGPTYEPIDPVRFIGNRSSGKMGVSIADALARKGADVTLILGPSKVEPIIKTVKIIRVETAQQMLDATLPLYPSCDAAILAAAVADYRTEQVSEVKIKKKGDTLDLTLVKNPDIAATLGKLKQQQILVGFALETNNELENAKEKLHKKNLNFIILNSLQDKGSGFEVDTNKVTFIFEDNKIMEFELKEKKQVANDIVSAIEDLLVHK
ncbi:MAG: bifunctional phosphopantothenoylcysteine decarboxylase/phosphopantothenate--cysteine ligase CoaBC [Saprospiraceae bacterium]|nr:bifunctional phosphopantothenoylcysteine decarboxylase/phosphopantothenate--cysteine ligase CoaBC [Saprospiraceae bacterium]